MEIFSFYKPQNDITQRLQMAPSIKSRKSAKEQSNFSRMDSKNSYTSAFSAPVYNSPIFAGNTNVYSDVFSVPISRGSYSKKLGKSIVDVLSAIGANAKLIFIAILIISFICSVLYFSVPVLNMIENIMFEPVPMDLLAEKDAYLVDDAMLSFIFTPPAPESVDAGGNILSAISNEKVIYTEPVSFSTYIVKPNDNITSISKNAGLTNISTLIAVNNITNVRRLQAGKRLTIPSIDGINYTISDGDTLDGISKKYGVSIEQLLDINDLSSAVLQKGQKIFVPGAKLSTNDLKKALGEFFIYPIQGKWRLSSNYGKRPDPFTGVISFHTGIDMVAAPKTAILASADGLVKSVSWSNVYGNYVIISHADGYQTLYAHLYSASVKQGQRVTQGAKIGHLGNTGYSTGPHLHFTVYKNNKLINPFEVLK
ncbi:MAG: M23 family metallopeptidase [Treponema sp.]|jgi:murein DD-endopeptidase MepM/ murein hydrolase activator NlpD|nr:M23 family metallopeptidase [Treponema sp.]